MFKLGDTVEILGKPGVIEAFFKKNGKYAVKLAEGIRKVVRLEELSTLQTAPTQVLDEPKKPEDIAEKKDELAAPVKPTDTDVKKYKKAQEEGDNPVNVAIEVGDPQVAESTKTHCSKCNKEVALMANDEEKNDSEYICQTRGGAVEHPKDTDEVAESKVEEVKRFCPKCHAPLQIDQGTSGP